jgi:acetyl esterase/lipase
MYSEKIRLYEDREDVTLTTYIQNDTDSLLGNQKRPAIVICPGGGYMKCATQEGEPVAIRFAAMGYHTFVLRYSTYFSMESNDPFPSAKEDIKVKEHCMFPNPMLEIGKAVLLIKEHANEWNVDEDRIALCGFSAGAHNVAMYANSWNTEFMLEYFKTSPDNLKPVAAILGYIAGDYYFSKMEDIKDQDKMFFRVSYTALLGKQELSDEDIERVRPSKHVNSDTPPTFLWATYEDRTVSVKNTLIMAEALADKKIPFEVHIFEEGHHGLSLATQESSKVKRQINQDASKWVSLAEAWLQKRLALELPEFL